MCMYLLLFGSVIIGVLFLYVCVCVHTVSIIDLYCCARPALHVCAPCVQCSMYRCVCVCVLYACVVKITLCV